MAIKEIAIGKRAKISEAQQYMLLSVLGASVVLGISIALTARFVQQISFNSKVIAAEEQSIASYSDVIKSTGVCKSPSGSVYSDEELQKCDPDGIDVSEVPGTLRYNVLVGLASNDALNSVPKEDISTNCISPSTGKNYTYDELTKLYDRANDSSELAAASQLIKSCSALRVIPDALPSFKNEEALLASLNKIFIVSGWEPEGLSPSSNVPNTSPDGYVNPISLNLAVEANSATTMTVLNNIERSIREFDIQSATINWSGEDSLSLRAQALAYYVDPSSIIETNKTITPTSP